MNRDECGLPQGRTIAQNLPPLVVEPLSGRKVTWMQRSNVGLIVSRTFVTVTILRFAKHFGTSSFALLRSNINNTWMRLGKHKMVWIRGTLIHASDSRPPSRLSASSHSQSINGRRRRMEEGRNGVM
jgi:hypothetical protein